MSTLKDRITDDMKAAMRAKEAERLGTIRMLLAAMKQREVDERIVLDDAAVVGIVDKLIKQRKDSITAFQQAGRTDLVDKESAELAVLLAYLPERMGAEEVAAAIVTVVDKMLKQRRDSVSQFEGAQRFDLASAERFEIEVLSAYKPEGLSTEQITTLIDAVIATTGAASPADMGKLMAELKPRLAGKADMAEVSKLVKARLGN